MASLTHEGRITSIQKGDIVAYDVTSRCLVFRRPDGKHGNVLEIDDYDKIYFPATSEIPILLLSIVKIISATNHGLDY